MVLFAFGSVRLRLVTGSISAPTMHRLVREPQMSWDFHNLFVRHAREINRFLRRRGHNAETAADITQDTFLRVLVAPPAEVCTKHNPRAYLYQVSRSLSVNHHRRESLIQTTDLDEAAGVADPAPTAEAVVYSRQCLAQTTVNLPAAPG